MTTSLLLHVAESAVTLWSHLYIFRWSEWPSSWVYSNHDPNKVCVLHLVVSPFTPTLVWSTTPSAALLLLSSHYPYPPFLNLPLDSEPFDAQVCFCALWDPQCCLWDGAGAWWASAQWCWSHSGNTYWMNESCGGFVWLPMHLFR